MSKSVSNDVKIKRGYDKTINDSAIENLNRKRDYTPHILDAQAGRTLDDFHGCLNQIYKMWEMTDIRVFSTDF